MVGLRFESKRVAIDLSLATSRLQFTYLGVRTNKGVRGDCTEELFQKPDVAVQTYR